MRIQYEVSRERNEQLENLKNLCGISTKKGLIDRALEVFEFLVDEKAKSRKIITISEDGSGREKELIILPLELVKNYRNIKGVGT